MSWTESIIWLVFWLVIAGAYVYVARHFNIVDHPNHRSSHQHVTIRGGGIVFWMGIMVSTIALGHFSLGFALSAGLLGLASFIDDLISVRAITRMIIQLTAVLLLFVVNGYFHGLADKSWIVIPIALIIILGSLNIYNFMDGINGLSVCYTLLGLTTLSVLDQQKTESYIFITIPLVAMAVFNVRPKGKAIFFSGDIGSITAGFALIYCIFQLCIQQDSIAYLSLILIYLIDGGWTIILRLFKKENIFEAHRSHVFQLLANEIKWGHLKVVSIYILFQMVINLLLYFELKSAIIDSNLWFLALFLIVSTLYFVIRYYIKMSVLSMQNSSGEL